MTQRTGILKTRTLLRLSGRYLTWCFICCTMFSLSESPSEAHVASSCCRLSVLSDVSRGREEADDVMSIVSMLSSSQSDVLVPVDSRLRTDTAVYQSPSLWSCHCNSQASTWLEMTPGKPNHTRFRATESDRRRVNIASSYAWKKACSCEHWRSIVERWVRHEEREKYWINVVAAVANYLLDVRLCLWRHQLLESIISTALHLDWSLLWALCLVTNKPALFSIWT